MKILDSKEQISVFSRLFEQQSKWFNICKNEDGNYYLLHFKGNKKYNNHYLKIMARNDKLGIILKGPSPKKNDKIINRLIFSTHSDLSTRNAALLVDNNGIIQLYHDGRVTPADGRGSPFSDTSRIFRERPYFLVGDIYNESFFEGVMAFHMSQLDHHEIEQLTVRPARGYDPGPQGGSARVSVVYSVGRHHPICKALREEMEGVRKYEIIENCYGPDLLVEKNGKRILFEVKPFGVTNDLITALGQLLVYNEDAEANDLVIVTNNQGPPKDAAFWCATKKYDIHIVRYSKGADDKIKFFGLDAVSKIRK